MKVTERTKRALRVMREEREMTKRGYRKHETDWEILRGFRMGDVIVDVKISADRRHVWTLLGPAA